MSATNEPVLNAPPATLIADLANDLAHAAHVNRLMMGGLLALMEHSSPNAQDRDALEFATVQLSLRAQALAEAIDPR